jgi:hypothetical protein
LRWQRVSQEWWVDEKRSLGKICLSQFELLDSRDGRVWDWSQIWARCGIIGAWTIKELIEKAEAWYGLRFSDRGFLRNRCRLSAHGDVSAAKQLEVTTARREKVLAVNSNPELLSGVRFLLGDHFVAATAAQKLKHLHKNSPQNVTYCAKPYVAKNKYVAV